MTYTITSECIRCQRCLSVCPTGAIQTNGLTFWIDTTLCTQCEGSYKVPQCWAICPTNEGCIPLVTGVAASLKSELETSDDYWVTWFAKYTQMVERLKASQRSPYWKQWFNVYSQTLQNLQMQRRAKDIPLMP